MPWYYQWTIGFNDASGKFQVKNGMNGSFCDHGASAGSRGSTSSTCGSTPTIPRAKAICTKGQASSSADIAIGFMARECACGPSTPRCKPG